MRSDVPSFLCLAPALLRGTAAAAGIALVNTVFSVGGFFGPSLIGWFSDSTGSTDGALWCWRRSRLQRRRFGITHQASSGFCSLRSPWSRPDGIAEQVTTLIRLRITSAFSGSSPKSVIAVEAL